MEIRNAIFDGADEVLGPTRSRLAWIEACELGGVRLPCDGAAAGALPTAALRLRSALRSQASCRYPYFLLNN